MSLHLGSFKYKCLSIRVLHFSFSFSFQQQCSIGLCLSLNFWSSWNILLSISKHSSLSNSYLLHYASSDTILISKISAIFYSLAHSPWRWIWCYRFSCYKYKTIECQEQLGRQQHSQHKKERVRFEAKVHDTNGGAEVNRRSNQELVLRILMGVMDIKISLLI